MHQIRLTSAALLVHFTTPVQANILGDWINNPGYLQGGTPKEQIKCYVLPYGALGFITHLLTSYCVACIARGRSPWHPGSRLRRPKLDIVLGLVGLIISLFVNMLVVFKCWNSWEFVLVAVWKIFLSLTLSAITLDAAFRTLRHETLGQATPETEGEPSSNKTHTAVGRFLDLAPNVLLPCAKNRRRPTSQTSGATGSERGPAGKEASPSTVQEYPKTLRWLFLDLAGTIAGCVGLFALMIRDDFERNKSFWAISLIFGLTAASVFGGALVWSYYRRINRRRKRRNDKANKRALEAAYEAGRNGVSRYSRILRTFNPSPPEQLPTRAEVFPLGVAAPCSVAQLEPQLFHVQRLQEIETAWLAHIKADREIPLVQLEDLPVLMIQLLVFAVVICCLLAALYSDWILAYTSGSWTGAPSTDNMLVSFLYMGSKLMPLFQS